MKLPELRLTSLSLPAGGVAVSPRVRRILALSGYPLFYLLCLIVFSYLTFPYERLKERLLAELEAQRQGNPSAQRIEVQSLGPYWFSGVSLKGVTIVSPKSPGSEPGAAPSKLTLDKAHLRVSILPLLIGRVTVSFGAKAFGGSIDGWTRANSDGRRIEATLDDVDLGQITTIGDAIGGLPMAGTLNGKMEWMLPDQKITKASGALTLTIADLAAGDGTTKIGGKLALPQIKLGAFELTAEAKDGILRVTKLAADGKDLDLAGEGKISLRDPPSDSIADLYLRFRFADAYKTKNEMTKSLFGAPGSTMPALFELADPRIKSSKRGDGFYGWHVGGQIKDPRFDPAPSVGSGSGAGLAPSPSPAPTRPVLTNPNN